MSFRSFISCQISLLLFHHNLNQAQLHETSSPDQHRNLVISPHLNGINQQILDNQLYHRLDNNNHINNDHNYHNQDNSLSQHQNHQHVELTDTNSKHPRLTGRQLLQTQINNTNTPSYYYGYRIATGYTWSEANAHCNTLNMTLASIHSSSDNVQVIGAINSTNGWIGFTDIAAESEWKWVDGTNEALYENWSPGQPDQSGEEDCAQILADGTWSDTNCSSKKNYFVCGGYGVISVNQDFYGIYSYAGASWRDGEMYCNNKYDSHLASISNHTDNMRAWESVSGLNVNAWIGLSDIVDGTFRWTDNSEFIYQYWSSPSSAPTSLPSSDVSLCVHYSGGSVWGASECNTTTYKYFVCKISGPESGPTSAPTGPTPSPS